MEYTLTSCPIFRDHLSGAVFFHHHPKQAILSDVNPRLIETYQAIKADWQKVWKCLQLYQKRHCKEYYYSERARTRRKRHTRAAQFLYLNRACWNGLYRVNLDGKFNVPIGTKSTIVFDTDDFGSIAASLQKTEICCCDFEDTIDRAMGGDFLFLDPPYTTAHNMNGFIKYNEKLFSWSDQIRLKDSLDRAKSRGALIMLTNANHESIRDLYKDEFDLISLNRRAILSGKNIGRVKTAEMLII